MRFLQLYTSKSFDSRRNDLLKPETEEEEDELSLTNTKADEKKSSIQKHVLSPMLVNAIAKNSQVVWANCQKQEGLLGRSDMRLQTAVGMPVAMDSSGNMCIVVMFSPKNVSSNKDAIEFIKLVSQGAASTKIPCLLPVVDSNQNKLAYNPKRFHDWQQNESHSEESMYIDLSHGHGNGHGHGQLEMIMNENNNSSTTSSSSNNNDALHELALLPKDQYGIPILPEFAVLNTDDEKRRLGVSSHPSEEMSDANEFDSATFGLWSTIMNSPKINGQPTTKQDVSITTFSLSQQAPVPTQIDFMNSERQQRLEEFVSAFLGLSVFDLADVWVPVTAADGSTSIHNVFAVASSETSSSSAVINFRNLSKRTIIKGWSGAVGRAQCSGHAVWSTNQDIITDCSRKDAFIAANIKTALAVPIYSHSKRPTCVLCFYSMVASNSETFILKFLQHALRSLWAGLDNVEPHESIGKTLWKGVAPADLGEMAADTEMQKAFYKKKRPHDLIVNSNMTQAQPRQLETDDERPWCRARSSSLAMQLQSLQGEKKQCIPQETDQNNYNPTFPFVNQATVNAPHTTITAPQMMINTAEVMINKTQPCSNISTVQPYQPQQHTPQLPVAQHQVYRQAVNNPPQPSMPNLNQYDFKEDPNTAKDFIDAINALVQNKTQPQTENNLVQNNQNFASDFVPEAALSSRMILCAPVLTPAPQGDNCAKITPTPIAESTISGKICRIEGCNTLSVSRRPYCSRHSGNRLCEYKFGCTKCAQGATRFCIAHGGGRRCTYPGCDKGARDKFFCAAHGGGKRCSKDGCKKSAVGGSNLCTSHGGGRRCTVEGCEKSAQSSTKFCVKHGGGKKCSHAGCSKVARGRTLYCAGHGGGIRCKLEGCSRIAIGKMQLCRAHGGGSGRSKAKATQNTASTALATQVFLQPSHVEGNPPAAPSQLPPH